MALFTAAMAFIKGLKFLKYLKPVAKYATPALGYVRKHWKISLIVVLTALLLAGTWLHNKEVVKLEAQIAQFQASLRDYGRINEANGREIDNCLAINRANAQAYVNAQLRAGEAVERARRAEQERDTQVEDIHEEVKELRGTDEDCRSLDDPLPDWFDEWLRQ